jgi:hypothetical protein
VPEVGDGGVQRSLRADEVVLVGGRAHELRVDVVVAVIRVQQLDVQVAVLSLGLVQVKRRRLLAFRNAPTQLGELPAQSDDARPQRVLHPVGDAALLVQLLVDGVGEDRLRVGWSRHRKGREFADGRQYAVLASLVIRRGSALCTTASLALRLH